MKKSEFKKMMQKENKLFKNYYVYEMILILLLAMIVIPNIILTINNKIPLSITIINTFLIIIMALPIMIMDIRHDIEIKKMYQSYLKDKKIPEYKEKTKMLNILLIISIVVFIIFSIITIPNISKIENLSEMKNTLIITTNKGNKVETQYEKLDGFQIKIPSEFLIMSDEAIHIKYPDENPPSLVYTNERGTINVALVMNDVLMKNSQIEEYMKTMETTYRDYFKDVKLNFWERNNHKIGEIEFITQVPDTEIYNHIIAFSVNDKLRLVNFNCTKEYIEEWQEVSKFILGSIIFE